jgi:ArsR family transcriptional regulator, arsenate/arsenite/antimonite-responsive transcriptional repressor
MNNQDSILFSKAIADSTRQQIMNLCCCKWLSVNDIVKQTNVSQPTVSHHLAILRQANLVRTRQEGKQIFYTLDQEKIATCCGNLVLRFAPDSTAASILININEIN